MLKRSQTGSTSIFSCFKRKKAAAKEEEPKSDSLLDSAEDDYELREVDFENVLVKQELQVPDNESCGGETL